MTRQPKGSGGARRTRCRCGQTVYRQIVGALDVTADADPLALAEALLRTGPNRLAWCLYQRSEWTPQKLREVSPSSHRADCPHPHVLDHQCTAPAATAHAHGRGRAGRDTQKTSVPEGQLTLDA